MMITISKPQPKAEQDYEIIIYNNPDVEYTPKPILYLPNGQPLKRKVGF